MNEFPFQLSVNCILPEKQTISLTCTSLLRFVKGRRKVYDATWNQKKVIAKLFIHKLSNTRHAKREWKGLIALSDKKINAPSPLFFGKTEAGDWVVITEKIDNSTTVLDLFNNSHNSGQKLELLHMVCRELAKQHKAGVLQKDFHLENFIVADSKIYTLDPGQMQFFGHEVSKTKSISNLAMLMLYLQDDDTESKQILCKEYYKLQSWQFDRSEELQLQKHIDFQRSKGIRRGLKKCLRTSKRFIRINENNITAVFDKTFCNENEFNEFLNQIDKLINNGRILKNGNTCFVSHFEWKNKHIVVKRYNHKNIIHSLRHTIMGSRAIKVWLHTQRLMMLGIDTPRPLVYLEKYKGHVLWDSYIVTEYVEGKNLFYFQNDKSISERYQEEVQYQIDELFDKMWKSHITHGDLKQSNILITKNGPFLTDLDSMKVHRFDLLYRLRQAKDVERFNKKIVL